MMIAEARARRGKSSVAHKGRHSFTTTCWPDAASPLLLALLIGTCCWRHLPTSVAAAPGSASIQVTQYPALQRCSSGPPLQWRPYLDAASKAHLAPAVVLASLKHLNLTPIQLTGGANGPLLAALQQQQLAYHAQNINNVGVNIEATFSISKVLKRTIPVNLKPMQTIKLFYRVSASLSTTSALMTLTNSNTMGPSSGGQQQANSSSSSSSSSSSNNIEQHANIERQQMAAAGSFSPIQLRQLMQRSRLQELAQVPCALDLSEHELVRKVDKIFKLNQSYVLFLDNQPAGSQQQQQQQGAATQAAISPPVGHGHGNAGRGSHRFQQQQQQVASGLQASNLASQETSPLYPFATHELLTNQTSRAVSKILCKNCAQVPQIQLVNSTFVAVAQQQQQQSQAGQANRIRLDCRVTGYPAPWVQWYRNGKLLRNRPGRTSMKTSRWKRRHNVRLSRLELELQPGRNETGVYECRAMNVAAREPAVGTYTLLVLPAHYALIPMPSPVPVDDVGSSSADAPKESAGAAARPKAGQRSDERRQSGNSETQPPATQQQQQQQATRTSPQQASTATSDGGATGSTAALASGSATPTTPEPRPQPAAGRQQEEAKEQQAKERPELAATTTTTTTTTPPAIQENSIQEPQPVVGQPCPREAHDNFCMNKGTCVLIGHIEEYYCNCAEGYHGHRCEYKSLGHTQQHLH